MSEQDLKKYIEELRDVLSVAESFLALEQMPPERVKDLGHRGGQSAYERLGGSPCPARR